MSDTNTKSIFLSKTFWGTILTAASTFAAIFGVEITGVENEAITQGAAGVLGFIGAVIAIIGRFKAKTNVTLTGDPK